VIKALGISGSPRKDGNTETLIDTCLEKLASDGIETEKVLLRGKTIRGCTACGICRERKDRTCSIKNDDFNGILEKMLEADIVVVGSPVYFGSATPEMMAVLDRAGYVSRGNGNLFSRKIGGPLAVARRAGQNFTYAQLLYWFTINDMIVPGSSYWNVAFGKGEGSVREDQEAISTITRFAENLAWLAKKLG
jgi:multimeric flavodoxin WrbA